MNENIQVALIAGTVSLVVTLIGLASSLLIQKRQSLEAEKQIRTEAASKLLALRLEHYPKAFDITEKIQRRKKPERIIARQELLDINNELLEWKTGIVNLIVSQTLLTVFINCVRLLLWATAKKIHLLYSKLKK